MKVQAMINTPDQPTEPDRAADLARAQAEWLRGTLASIGDAVITTDAAGMVTFMNSVAEALTSWPLAEASGRPLEEVFQIVDETTRAPAENPAGRVLREGVVLGLANHTLLLSRDGLAIPIDDSGAPIRDRDGHIIGVVLIFRDITERRRAELAQLHLAAIVESSDDAIISKDLAGTVLSWNQGAERMYGYTAAEMQGRSIGLIFPPDRLDELSHILERLKRGEHIDHYETVRVRKDGQQIHISLTISPIRDASGTIVAASTIARDITERKRAEQELRQSRDQIEIMLRGVADGITAQNPSGQLIYANDMAARMTGYASAQELLDAPLQQLLGKFDLLDEAGEPLPIGEMPSRLALQGIQPAPRTVR
ncbi:MAG TPA: PAS domain S-box protein, partial [Roseiflexaceae bacterium]|nr:PAS domain S-box protein [Roseiflexaceae bacterium]